MIEIVKTYPSQYREADCLDCNAGPWTSVNAMGIALKHARAFGHAVEGHSSTHFRYAPKAEEPVEAPYEADEDEHGRLREERDE